MAVTPRWPGLPLDGAGEIVLVNGEEIANVLVSPADLGDADLGDPAAPAGPRADIRLDFPKSYCGDLAGAVVEARGMLARVVGKPVRYAEDLTPGEWNCKALAVSAPGDMTADVRVVFVGATVDDEGEPVRVPEVVYEGPAQARMTGGSTPAAPGAERRARETWHFVAPWREVFGRLAPQAVRVEFDGSPFEAAYLRDVDGQGLFCDIEAVRHV